MYGLEVELVHECFHKQLRRGTARMKQNKETQGKKKSVSIERSKSGTKEKEVMTAYHVLIKIQ